VASTSFSSGPERKKSDSSAATAAGPLATRGFAPVAPLAEPTPDRVDAADAASLSHDFGQVRVSRLGHAPVSPPLQAKREHDGKPKDRTGMPDRLQTGLEQLSGFDLSGVRVHRGSDKPAKLQALAYTQGQNIHVGPGQERHLPHEGWHAVQQMQGRVKPTMKAHGVAINDNARLEREADVMGAKAVQMKQDPSEGP
jgi:hypothetical protein